MRKIPVLPTKSKKTIPRLLIVKLEISKNSPSSSFLELEMARHFWGLYFKPTELIGAVGNAAMGNVIASFTELKIASRTPFSSVKLGIHFPHSGLSRLIS